MSQPRSILFPTIVLLGVLGAIPSVAGSQEVDPSVKQSPESAIQRVIRRSQEGNADGFYDECIPLFAPAGKEIAFLEQRRAELHGLLNTASAKQFKGNSAPIPFNSEIVHQFLGERVSALESVRATLATSKQTRVLKVGRMESPFATLRGYYDEEVDVAEGATVQIEVGIGARGTKTIELFALRITDEWKVVDHVGWLALSLPNPDEVLNAQDEAISRLRKVNDGYRNLLRRIHLGQIDSREEVVRLMDSAYAIAGWANGEDRPKPQMGVRKQSPASESIVVTLSNNGEVRCSGRQLPIKEVGELLSDLAKVENRAPTVIVRFGPSASKRSIDSLLTVIGNNYDPASIQFSFPRIEDANAFLRGLDGENRIFAKSEVLLESEEP